MENANSRRLAKIAIISPHHKTSNLDQKFIENDVYHICEMRTIIGRHKDFAIIMFCEIRIFCEIRP